MTKEEIWQAILGELELSLSEANFATWFKETFIYSIENNEMVIAVPNSFTQNWLEKKYHKIILEIVKNLTDEEVKKISYKIEIHPSAKGKNFLENAGNRIKVNEEKTNIFGLNPSYTFSRFVVGKNNELAHAACLAVTQHLGRKYNPLFIYSGVGLGKTHLIQAIGHNVINQFPKKNILYANCEKFTNDYIQSVKEGRAKEFKNLYRNVDVLLIDDIQFIGGKEGTQEEFFHTFNELHQKDKQIIITSDRVPKAILGMEERLTSRFEWGMIVDISKPDLETRVAILKSKCQEKGYNLEESIIDYIGSQVQNNIRELEGVLNKIIAYHELNNASLDIELVKNIISNLSSQSKRGSINIKQLIKMVADFYGIKLENLIGKSRMKTLALPRQIAMYLLREELNTSYPAIGQELGDRDHTTAIHAYNKIKKEVENETRIKDEIDMIKQRIYNY